LTGEGTVYSGESNDVGDLGFGVIKQTFDSDAGSDVPLHSVSLAKEVLL
jgi:hypothetical protein